MIRNVSSLVLLLHPLFRLNSYIVFLIYATIHSQPLICPQYLSSLNFTQNFEYAPNSTAGRIFCISMGVWALVITATYTANLASLFVEIKGSPPALDSLDTAVRLGRKICTYANTNADSIVADKHPSADRLPLNDELSQYKALNRGDCQVVVGYKANFEQYLGMSDYNPDCNLEWVGREVAAINSGFAVKADAGFMCTSFIRDVLNLHLTEIKAQGILTDMWEKHYATTADQNCELDESDVAGERQLRTITTPTYRAKASTGSFHKKKQRLQQSRRLKAAKAGGSDDMAGVNGQQGLTLQQMCGTFVLHWCVMAASVALAAFSRYYNNVTIKDKDKKEVRFRRHGPIIGFPPPTNTVVSKKWFNTETISEKDSSEETTEEKAIDDAPNNERRRQSDTLMMPDGSDHTRGSDFGSHLMGGSNHTRGYDSRMDNSAGSHHRRENQLWYQDLVHNQHRFHSTLEEMRQSHTSIQHQQRELTLQQRELSEQMKMMLNLLKESKRN